MPILRPLAFSLLLAPVLACAGSPPAEVGAPAESPAPAVPSAAQAPVPSSTAVSRPEQRTASADEAHVTRDVELIVGGMFEPDHLGPKWHAEVVARLEARPALYLSEAVRLSRTFGRARLSEACFDSLLMRTAQLAPEETQTAARKLLEVHRRGLDAATTQPLDDSEATRFREKITAIQHFASSRGSAGSPPL